MEPVQGPSCIWISPANRRNFRSWMRKSWRAGWINRSWACTLCNPKLASFRPQLEARLHGIRSFLYGLVSSCTSSTPDTGTGVAFKFAALEICPSKPLWGKLILCFEAVSWFSYKVHLISPKPGVSSSKDLALSLPHANQPLSLASSTSIKNSTTIGQSCKGG